MSAIIEDFQSKKKTLKDWPELQIVERLRLSREVTHNIRHNGVVRELPSRKALQQIFDTLSAALFPTHFGQATEGSIDLYVSSSLQVALARIQDQVKHSLQFDHINSTVDLDLQEEARRIVNAFADKLPDIRNLLVSDFRAAYKESPTAESLAEIVLCHRNSTSLVYHRFAHILFQLGARLLARMAADIALAATGTAIHPGASVGEGFNLGQGAGTSISQDTIIGKNVRLFHSVALGPDVVSQTKPAVSKNTNESHVVIEDDVTIYSGVTVTQGVTVGRGSVIGSNVWLAQSVPPDSHITQAPAKAVG
jgi:serine O-acetyltransferase